MRLSFRLGVGTLCAMRRRRVVVRGLQRVRPGGPKVEPKLVPMPARAQAAAAVGQVSDASQKR